MTGLKDHIYHTVYLIFVDQSSKKLQTIRVRRHNRTSNAEVSSCDCIVDIFCVLVYQLVNGFCTAAIFKSYNNTTIVFYCSDHFFSCSSDWTSCDQNTRFLLFHLAFCIFFFNLRSKSIHFARDQGTVKFEGASVQNFEQILSFDRSRIMFHHFIKFL